MRSSRSARFPLAAVACLALLAACSKSTTTSNTSPSGRTSSSASPLSGSANIFAAQSLKGAFDKIDAAFMDAHPGVTINPNYNGSGTLVTQIQQGAPADVFASADNANMSKLTAAGTIATSTVKTLLRNVLQIVVKSGNPKGIKTLADLAKPGVVVVLGDPASVPAGKYAQQAFQQAGLTVTAKSLETNVTAVLTKVALGEADAGIVYVTDVKVAIAGGQAVEGIDIPTAQNVVATYPVGPLAHAPNPAVASAYISYLLSTAGQATLASFGFLPPS
jgi:molybdate transport system substrate-binding protein